MFNTDLSKYKVIYDDKVLRALTLVGIEFSEKQDMDEITKRPSMLEILIIDEDGRIKVIRDKENKFQFIPIIGG